MGRRAKVEFEVCYRKMYIEAVYLFVKVKLANASKVPVLNHVD